MARIITIENWNSEDLFVPGTDPAQIIADGNAWLFANAWDLGAAEDVTLVVTTPPEQIEIGWYRVNPCSASNCGGGHPGHWIPTEGQTRGGFQGAMVAFGIRAETPMAVVA